MITNEYMYMKDAGSRKYRDAVQLAYVLSYSRFERNAPSSSKWLAIVNTSSLVAKQVALFCFEYGRLGQHLFTHSYRANCGR